MEPEALRAIRVLECGAVDMSEYRSRQLTSKDIEDADVVVGMAREHVREVVVLIPEAWNRTFTLKELVRVGEQVGNRIGNEKISDWLARASEGRRRQDHLGASTSDDVEDPIGGTPLAFKQSANEIDLLCRQLVELLWG